MAHEIRKAVIRRIADQKRVSLAVAAYIYSCKPIAVKQRLCAEEEKRRERPKYDPADFDVRLTATGAVWHRQT